MLNKDIKNGLAAIVIILSGLVILIYTAFQIDWVSIEFSFQSVFFPIFFIFIIALFVFKVVGSKDIDITSKETDKKIIEAVDGFNYKTRYIQGFIIGLLILILIAFYFIYKV